MDKPALIAWLTANVAAWSGQAAALEPLSVEVLRGLHDSAVTANTNAALIEQAKRTVEAETEEEEEEPTPAANAVSITPAELAELRTMAANYKKVEAAQKASLVADILAANAHFTPEQRAAMKAHLEGKTVDDLLMTKALVGNKASAPAAAPNPIALFYGAAGAAPAPVANAAEPAQDDTLDSPTIDFTALAAEFAANRKTG